jgi:hypothetical protein
VKFRPSLERIAVTYCMATCEQNDDCRYDEGYRCTTQGELGDGEAEVLGRASQEFCSVPLPLMSIEPEPDPEPEPDASSSDEDAGR